MKHAQTIFATCYIEVLRETAITARSAVFPDGTMAAWHLTPLMLSAVVTPHAAAMACQRVFRYCYHCSQHPVQSAHVCISTPKEPGRCSITSRYNCNVLAVHLGTFVTALLYLHPVLSHAYICTFLLCCTTPSRTSADKASLLVAASGPGTRVCSCPSHRKPPKKNLHGLFLGVSA